MSSPAPDARPGWTDGEPQAAPRHSPEAGGSSSGGRHRAPRGHRARASVGQTPPPRPAGGGATPPPGGSAPSGSSGSSGSGPTSLVRSSSVMAVGTLASRVTGLLRTLVLVPAIGQTLLANSYNYANTLPNTVYNVAIGGILTSVIVPLLVNAARRDSDRGEKYDQRMFTLVTGF